MAGTRRTYSPWLGRLWVAAAVAGVAYGIFLLVTAVGLPAGFELTGRFPGQPAVKALMALLLAAAALAHPVIAAATCVLGSEALAVPIWWAYSISQVLITAGFFFRGIPSDESATPAL